jgi:hypothetical protein
VTLAACSRGGEPPAASTASSGSGATASAAPAPATPVPAPPLPAAGPRAQGEQWTAALTAPAAFRAGEPTAARVRITARGGYHVNPDYPLAFVPAADASADFASARVALTPSARTPCEAHPGDACEVVADVPLVPRDGATLRVAGTVAFSVCTAERCLIEKVPLAVNAP